KELDIDFITGSAHKFHGPKGVGFIYINKKNKINPFIHGGGQERNMRGGTENVYGIDGLAKALEISAENREKNNKHIRKLKRHKKNTLIHRGGQERKTRGGTENVYGIDGLAKALEISAENREKNNKHIRTLKSHMIKELQKNIKDLKFNGISHKEETLYTVL